MCLLNTSYAFQVFGIISKMPPSLCISIDFGTSRSGVAYAFASAPQNVLAHQQWPGAPASNLKTSTSILLEAAAPHETVAFGDQAHQMFVDMEPREREEVLYFDRFKMKLFQERGHGKGEPSLTILSADQKRKLPVRLVLSRALQYMKSFSLKLVRESAAVDEDHVLFVITVPAIWDFAAKALVREAAFDAEISNFVLSLEPEAAALACIQEQKLLQQDRCSEYMVIDAGGGTVDIVAHRIDQNSKGLEELCPPSGGPWGSTAIDTRFISLLDDLFGSDVLNSFRERNSADWLYLLKSWEVAKTSFRQRRGDASQKAFSVLLPVALVQHLGEQTNLQGLVEERTSLLFPSLGEGPKPIRYQRGRLRLDESILQYLYQPVLDSISSHISELFKDERLSSIRFVFLVGGMASCALLHECLEKPLPENVKLISPQQPDLAVAIGAALFGLAQESITTRIAKHTFGMKVMRKFDSKIHPRSKKTVAPDGRELCRDLFMKFVQKGKSLPVDHMVEKEVRSMKDLDTAKLEIFASEAPDPQFVTDDGVQKLATLTVGTEKGQSQTIRVEIKFAQTDLQVSAVLEGSGKKLSSRIQFSA